jgi:phosphoribosylformylglycinamidine synthase
MTRARALVLTGYGLNCDYETDHALRLAGADSYRIHMNAFIRSGQGDHTPRLRDFHILVFGGGFSWADDHGAGVLMATKLRHHLGKEIEAFIAEGKLILGICNGFQVMVNLGLLPGFDGAYNRREVALASNSSGNFIDTWVTVKAEPQSPCIFTRGIGCLDLPVRHGEGKFQAEDRVLKRLLMNHQVALRYVDATGEPAAGRWPVNPNGSLEDVAGICDPTGRVFGLMPHPEAFNHFTNHPEWTRKKESLVRQGQWPTNLEGDGIQVFRNAVRYVEENL